MARTELIWFTYSEYFGKTVVKSPGTTIYKYGQIAGNYKSVGSESGWYGIRLYAQQFGKPLDLLAADCVKGIYGLPFEIAVWHEDVVMPNTQLKIIVRGRSGSSDCDHTDWEKVITFIPYEDWEPVFKLPTLKLAPLPTPTLQLKPSLQILAPIALKPLPALTLTELKNLLFSTSLSLPSLPSLSVSLRLIGDFLPILHLRAPPALTPALELLPFPHDVLTDTIISENAHALAEASFEHARRFSIPGFTQPPFFCFICGETFNNHDDFISHLVNHVQAYEEANYD
ncbi:MAG: hypothetical protein DRO73_11025 [Candidatus Thorarchaeota archaeon]|nr:MAG: hypothetical protein DRO73_11025 [Candidatus Thorarchaeota archaeon]